MISNKELPLTLTECHMVRETLESADLDVVIPIAIISHCKKCLTCQSYSYQLSNLRKLLRTQMQVKAPIDFDIKLRQKIAAHKHASLNVPWWKWMSQPALAATATALTIVGILMGADYFYFMLGAKPSEATISTPIASSTPVAKKEFNELANNNEFLTNKNLDTPKTIATSPRSKIDNYNTLITQRVLANRRIVRSTNRAYLTQSQNRPEKINIEIHYGNSSSRTLPVSAVIYGAKPVVTIDNPDTSEIRSSGIIPESKIF
ncbi:MAG: hypothetical protein WAQ98_03920 [Blastocatellia bacterium]